MTDRRPRTNWPHDVPNAAELVEAVRHYLTDDLGPRAEGRDRFLLRVASNALAIVERELELGPDHAIAHAERLAALGVDSEEELSQAIRRGELDDRTEELAGVLWATTLDKLAVANPRYRDESAERTV